MSQFRERMVCSCCEGRGIITRDNPLPGRWFYRMGLIYLPGRQFTVKEGPRHDEVWYGSTLIDSGLSDGQELADERNRKLALDTAPQVPCSSCMGVGTRPKPLERDEQAWDRGELQAEAFGAGGMQGYQDFQEEWSEYVGQTGSHADPIQKLVEAEWAKHLYQVSGPDPWEDR